MCEHCENPELTTNSNVPFFSIIWRILIFSAREVSQTLFTAFTDESAEKNKSISSKHEGFKFLLELARKRLFEQEFLFSCNYSF